MTITDTQLNFAATVSRCVRQIDDCSGCSCQQSLVCVLVILHMKLFFYV